MYGDDLVQYYRERHAFMMDRAKESRADGNKRRSAFYLRRAAACRKLLQKNKRIVIIFEGE